VEPPPQDYLDIWLKAKSVFQDSLLLGVFCNIYGLGEDKLA
jgi:hypothetical protein